MHAKGKLVGTFPLRDQVVPRSLTLVQYESHEREWIIIQHNPARIAHDLVKTA